LTDGLAGWVPVAMMLGAMAVVSVVLAGAVYGLVNGIVVRAPVRSRWFLPAGHPLQRRLVSGLMVAVTAGAVMATRPLWLWVSVTPSSFGNPVFVLSPPFR
jgi:hypothetical protein